jgi:hypothetical protein
VPATLTAERRERVGWTLIALSLALTWLSTARVLRIEGLPYPHGLASCVDLSFLVQPAGAAVATTLYVVCLVAGLLALVTHLASCQSPSDLGTSHATTMGGATMFAFVLAQAVLRRRDEAVRARAGLEAMVGITAACYVVAGASKLSTSGLAWADGSHLALHIASHAAASTSSLATFRLAVASHAALLTPLAIGTLLIECSFVLFVVPRLRAPYALLSTGMHLSISLLMGLHHEEWMLMVLGLTLLTRSGDARAGGTLGSPA